MGGPANDGVNGGDGTDACEGETEIDCELDPSNAAAWMFGLLGSWSQGRSGPGAGGVSTRPPYWTSRTDDLGVGEALLDRAQSGAWGEPARGRRKRNS
jgi:hypothetical protein